MTKEVRTKYLSVKLGCYLKEIGYHLILSDVINHTLKY